MSVFDSFYLLDEADRIVDWGGPAWGAVVREEDEDAPNLSGRSIYDFVAGHFTKRFLRMFLTDARAAPGGLARTYRCDSPRMKRLMEMRAKAQGAGALHVEHWLVEETSMAFEVATREPADSSAVRVLRCSLCNRLSRTGANAWREPDEFVSETGFIPVVHTVCRDCRRGVTARLPHLPAPVAIPAGWAGSKRPATPPSSS